MYFEWLASSDAPDACQYREVVQAARRDRKPLFFVDVNLSAASGESEMFQGNVLRTIESALGVSLVGLTAAELHHSKNVALSRRAFLSHVLKGAAALYLLTPRAQQLTSSMSGTPPDESSVSRKTQRGLQLVNAVLHPELNNPLKLDHRNTIMAQNAEAASLMLSKELGRTPTSALYVGANHTGIEQELQTKEARRVEHIKQHPELNHHGKIARVDFKNEDGVEAMRIQILQDPAFE